MNLVLINMKPFKMTLGNSFLLFYLQFISCAPWYHILKLQNHPEISSSSFRQILILPVLLSPSILGGMEMNVTFLFLVVRA